ncbi:MAG: penicillin-binding protein 1C [Candidatus Neomarinimicrobiota bacterium]
MVLIGGLYLIIPPPDPLFPVDKSTVVLAEDGEILRVFLNSQEQWYFPPDPEKQIPLKLQKALLTYEDRHFYRHFGVNPGAIVRAIKQNIDHHKIISGASTINMQVTRMMRHKPRTLVNKIIEIGLAVRLEVYYPKDEILRIYLENAPFGGNIIGYQTASYKYFNKPPEQLTWSEAATLAVLPNAPGIIAPQIDHSRLIAKRNMLLKQLLTESVIDEETYTTACLETVIEGTYDFPFLAPHLAENLKRKTAGESEFIHTTIDNQAQEYLEYLVQDHLKFLKSQGIKNGAILVVDNKNGEIRAYVGSQDFFDSVNGGQVDGVAAPRSSGSILKPFLYALAMDHGLLIPQSVLVDIPTYYGSYSPANANNTYDGLVTANDALIRSLNVPAVRLLKEYGIAPFYQFLKKVGVSHLYMSADEYGLPLILGGAEVSLADLAVLYHGLSHGGIFTPLNVIQSDNDNEVSAKSPIHTQERLFSESACYLTLEILRELKRPGAEYYWHQYQNQWPIAWKTGTSYGQRDAWAVGVSPQWLIAVWIGNFTGEPNTNLAGAKSAGTLLFDVYNYLPKDAEKCWFETPYWDMEEIEICTETGYIASEACPHHKTIYAPITKNPLKRCPYHHSICVTLDNEYQVCSRCWEGEGHKNINVIEYPPGVAYYLQLRGNYPDRIPSHNPDCQYFAGNKSMEIIYPDQDAYIWIPRDYDGNYQKITFKAVHLHPDIKIYWYLDDLFLGVTEKHHTVACTAEKGWHELQIVDADGQRDQKKFYIEIKSNLSYQK